MTERGPVTDLLQRSVDEVRLARNLAGVRRRQHLRRMQRARLAGAAAALALGCLALAGGLLRAPPSDDPPPPLHSVRHPELPLRFDSPATVPRDVALDDGSRLHLGEGTELAVVDNSRGRFRTLLDRGWVRYMVRPDGPRVWVVEAGLFQVEVVGTAFTVSRSRDAARIVVHRGRVLVRGAEVPGGVRQLHAGQRLDVRRSAAATAMLSPRPTAAMRSTPTEPVADRRRAAVDRVRTSTEDPDADATIEDTTDADTAENAEADTRQPSPADRSSAPFASLEQRTAADPRGEGRSSEVHEATGRQRSRAGVPSPLAESMNQPAAVPMAARPASSASPRLAPHVRWDAPSKAAEEPAAARSARHDGVRDALRRADALRAEGDLERAVEVLSRAIEDYPAAPGVALAALTLARLQLSLPASAGVARQAASSLERAVQLGLPSDLREQAHALRVQALSRAGQASAARAAAEAYRKTYPEGAWSAWLDTWLQAARPTRAP